MWRRNDDGAALPVALVFVAVFSLLVGEMLQFTQANVVMTTVVQTSLSATEAADAAAEGAVDQLQEDPKLGTGSYSDPSCFSVPAGQLTNVAGSLSTACTARAGSGSFASPSLSVQPAESIRTTGSGGAAEGVNLAGGASYVQGTVATRALTRTGGLSVIGGSGTVVASSCSGAGVVSPTPDCAGQTPIDPQADTNPTIANSWAYPNVPSSDVVAPGCGVATAWKVQWSPGRYSSGAAFQAALNCANRVQWFQPGVYYLDFSDAVVANKTITVALSGISSQMVAGAASGLWNPASITAQTVPTKGACDTSVPGVVFVLGQDARFVINNGAVEMCGWWDTTSPGQHLSIVAPNADITSTGNSSVSAPATASTSTGAAWTVPGSGGSLASWTGANSSSGFLVLTFPALNVPANATVTGVTTTFSHTMTTSGTAEIRSDFILPGADPTNAAGYKPLPSGNAFITCTPCADNPATRSVSYNLNQGGGLPNPPTPAQANGIRVRFQVGALAGAALVERLSSVQLTVQYTFPVLTRSTGSTVVLTVAGDGLAAQATTVSIHGTVYAPNGMVTLSETNTATTVVDRGIVARHATLSMTRAATFAGALVAIASYGGSSAVPYEAILATGSGNATEGLTVPGVATHVQGPIAVSPSLAVGAGGSLAVDNGRARATSCSPVVPTVTRPAKCSSAAPVDPDTDPSLTAGEQAAWAAPITALYPDVQTVPPCATTAATPVGTFTLTTLTPGTYTRAAALQTLINTCANSVIWFSPGRYNFEFFDASPVTHALTFSPLASSAIVAGSRSTTWAANTVPAPPTTSTSACDPDVTGVVFILNGDSRIDVTAGNVQICGAFSAVTSQHLAVYGTQATSAAPGIEAANDSTLGTGTGWTNPNNAISVDGTGATISSNATTQKLNVQAGNFRLPDDATSVVVTATVTHAPGAKGTIFASFVDSTGTESAAKTLRTCGAACSGTVVDTVTFNVATGVLATGGAVRLWFTGNGTMTENVDAIRLSATYQASFNALAGSNVATPYTPGSATNTAAFRISGSSAAAVNPLKAVVLGTIYTITGAVDISETSSTFTVVDRGIVARTVYLGATAGAGFTGPLVSVPWKPRAPRSVDVAVTLNGTVVLRAQVDFTDVSGLFDGDTTVVRRWSHRT